MNDKPQSLNLELLIKLLKLTASSNDSEALLAMRKASEVLLKFGGDWEALLRGKVTVIADPFSAAPPPPAYASAQRAPPPPPTPPPPPPPPRPAYAPQASPYYSQPRPRPQAAAQSQPVTPPKRKTMGKKLPPSSAADLA